MKFKIREIREQRKISQEELSSLSNVSRAIISGLETGKITTTTTDTLIKLANALEVTASPHYRNAFYMLWGNGEGNSFQV